MAGLGIDRGLVDRLAVLNGLIVNLGRIIAGDKVHREGLNLPLGVQGHRLCYGLGEVEFLREFGIRVPAGKHIAGLGVDGGRPQQITVGDVLGQNLFAIAYKAYGVVGPLPSGDKGHVFGYGSEEIGRVAKHPSYKVVTRALGIDRGHVDRLAVGYALGRHGLAAALEVHRVGVLFHVGVELYVGGYGFPKLKRPFQGCIGAPVLKVVARLGGGVRLLKKRSALNGVLVVDIAVHKEVDAVRID